MSDTSADRPAPTSASQQHDILIVTGMSGAGRSTVGKALEDLGWYVVDNLPTQMLGPLTELADRAGEKIPKIATVVDVRGGRFFTDPEQAVEQVRAGTSARVRVLFLEATDAVLVRRFEQVRRPHPLQGDGTLLDGIGLERSRLSGLREASDVVIDTSDLNIHQLANAVTDRFADDHFVGVQVTLMSFGFKYGLPADADMVADVRFIPNPYWVPELRPHTGLDAPSRSTSCRSRVPARSSSATPPCSSPCWRDTSARTKDTLRSPSAVPAASTARSPSSPSWRTSSAGCPTSPCV